MTDETHDAARQSWVVSANGHSEFPLQNLPFGVFSPPGSNVPDARPRGGIAIGERIFDLKAALAAGLFSGRPSRAFPQHPAQHPQPWHYFPLPQQTGRIESEEPPRK